MISEEKRIFFTEMTVYAVSIIFLFLGCMEFNRMRTVKKQLVEFNIALEAYRSDCGNYPTVQQGLIALKVKPVLKPVSEKWNGPYGTGLSETDPWGHRLQYDGKGHVTCLRLHERK